MKDLKMNFQLVFACLLAVSVQKSFTSPVADVDGEHAGQYIDEEVQQLENLHRELPKINSTENRPRDEPKPEPKTDQAIAPQNADDGEKAPQSNSRSGIFRHRGITQAKKSKAWRNEHPDFSEYVKFSPSDLAEYVFRTGDEEGVAVAVEELVREGVMGRTDAINYLQDVKQELTYMKDQYDQQRKLQEMRNKIYSRPQMAQRLLNLPRQDFSSLDAEKREPKPVEQHSVPSTTTEQHQQMVTASTPAPKLSTHSAGIEPGPKEPKVNNVSEQPQRENAKRQQQPESVAASYYDEYALEEVLYYLAKNNFDQSIKKSDENAEETLSSLVAFLEGEVGKKSISPQMKERILGIVSAALVDSLRDYQVRVPGNQTPLREESGPFKNSAEAKGVPRQKEDLPDAFRKFNLDGPRNLNQSPPSGNGQKSS